MTDDSSNQSPPAGRASSPFDEPTEQIVLPEHTTTPQTDDDLGPDPLQTPVYTPQPGPTEEQSAQSGALAADGSRTYAFASSTPGPADTGVGTAVTPERYRDETAKRGTTDLGLLVMRVTIGAVFLVHGLQKLTGWWGGSGLDGIESMMDRGGWDEPVVAGVLLIAGEIAGGTLLILGLVSPLAAGALLAVAIDAWLFRQVASPGLQYFDPNGPELESVLVGATTALILTGPGRYALDAGRGWATRPMFGSVFVLLLAGAAAACTWIFLHGGNPFI